MINSLKTLRAIIWKDLIVEFRSKEIILPILAFSCLTLIIFNFAIDTTRIDIKYLAAGILWIVFIFTSILILVRSSNIENQNGNLQGLLLSPISREAIFFSKLISNFIFVSIIQIIITIVFIIIFNFSDFNLKFIPIILLGTFGIITIGNVFSIISNNTKSQEIILSVLLFPTITPVLIASVEAINSIIGNNNDWLNQWIPLLIIFDTVFIIISPYAFNFIVEE
ncbi:MAG: heme exporter protein CcmB [SAR202 cluster bacterium]|jgi:heme exporter protein B|nr:heme exporter protein CcmB [SAR202 cluster bacterium]|tara:strand:+ start:231 stop:902 length:672 start_codon:yes stop_codon:yes gene_type:complete